jgi:hypothetical protein
MNAGTILKNTSGKRLQNELRLSDEFCWQPGERIKIKYPCKAAGSETDGYIVENMDYCGNERCFETSWISDKFLTENFTKI